MQGLADQDARVADEPDERPNRLLEFIRRLGRLSQEKRSEGVGSERSREIDAEIAEIQREVMLRPEGSSEDPDQG